MAVYLIKIFKRCVILLLALFSTFWRRHGECGNGKKKATGVKKIFSILEKCEKK